MAKKSRQKLKFVENEKNFQDQIKTIFHHFYRTFSCQKYQEVEHFNFLKMDRDSFVKIFKKI